MVMQRRFASHRDTWTPKTPLRHQKDRRPVFSPTMKNILRGIPRANLIEHQTTKAAPIASNFTPEQTKMNVINTVNKKEKGVDLSHLTKKMFLENARNKLKLVRCGNGDDYIPMLKGWFISGEVGWHGHMRKKANFGNVHLDALYNVNARVIGSEEWADGEASKKLKMSHFRIPAVKETAKKVKGMRYPSCPDKFTVKYGAHSIALIPQRMSSSNNEWIGIADVKQKFQGNRFMVRVTVNVTIGEWWCG